MDPMEDMRRDYYPFRLMRVKCTCGADGQTFGKRCFRKFFSFLLVQKGFSQPCALPILALRLKRNVPFISGSFDARAWPGTVSRFSLVGILSIFASDPSVDVFFASFHRSVLVLFPCRQSAA
jgi:hypothetical protein